MPVVPITFVISRTCSGLPFRRPGATWSGEVRLISYQCAGGWEASGSSTPDRMIRLTSSARTVYSWPRASQRQRVLSVLATPNPHSPRFHTACRAAMGVKRPRSLTHRGEPLLIGAVSEEISRVDSPDIAPAVPMSCARGRHCEPRTWMAGWVA